MVSEKDHDPRVCQQFHTAIELIGKRWTGAILYALLQRERRFSEFRDALPDMSDRLLTERLKELESHQLIVRDVHVSRPIQVFYRLTDKGKELQPILDAIGHWAWKWSADGRDGAALAENSTPDCQHAQVLSEGHEPV